jgi:hypothetical protein
MDNNSMKLTGRIGDSNDETFIVSVSPAIRMDQIFSRFLAQHTPFGFESSVEDIAYHPLPYKPGSDDELLLDKPWRVWLELYAKDKRMYMGLDLYGDVILGRGKSQPGRIILDLEPYGAHAMGVSREHVMLRPTRTRLFAIDRGSTNSTSVNGVHSGPGVATRLNDEDLMTLGNMIIMVHVISRPDTPSDDGNKPTEAADAKAPGAKTLGGKTPTAAVEAKKAESAGGAKKTEETESVIKPAKPTDDGDDEEDTAARETGQV